MNQLQTIQSKIYEIRGQRVMLDFDLAKMYGTETKVLKQAIKHKISRKTPDITLQFRNLQVLCHILHRTLHSLLIRGTEIRHIIYLL